jgi:peptidoglycan/LPS O-acetylase OafA/YrhL
LLTDLPSLVVEGEGPRTASGALKLPYIDCLRGYAVLLVIMCHTAGWYGVQLFFMASCLTLMMSALNERERFGSFHSGNFFVRRFLRIAPMYYIAALIYYFTQPPAAPSVLQALASLTFVNAWHPVTMPTVIDAWDVVPGGWSIGVEFTFYFLFPLFASLVTNMQRALVLLVASIVAAAVLNSWLLAPLSRSYGYGAADNFLYFWFLNQAPIFALGAVMFFLLKKIHLGDQSPFIKLIGRHSSSIAFASGILFISVVLGPPELFIHQFQLQPRLPQYAFIAVILCLFIVAVSQSRNKLIVNNVIGNIGTVSFSSYLLHFAVITFVIDAHPEFFHLGSTGWLAILVFFVCLVCVSVITLICSALTYWLIEAPMMRLAKRLTRRRVQPIIISEQA